MTLRLVSVIFFVLATSNAGAATAPRCGVNVHVPAQRVFAKVDDSEAWREYRSIEDVPALDPNGGISAQLWTGTGGTSFVRTVEPGEDFWIYTEYCFTKGGQLSRVGFELRTAWGWAYRLESPVENGTIHDASSGFFSTQTEKSIAKPEQADDVSQALRPTLYPQASQLPFSKLLDTSPKSGLPPSPK
jgi:hypothetical protein